jgi:hypothetical protein
MPPALVETKKATQRSLASKRPPSLVTQVVEPTDRRYHLSMWRLLYRNLDIVESKLLAQYLGWKKEERMHAILLFLVFVHADDGKPAFSETDTEATSQWVRSWSDALMNSSANDFKRAQVLRDFNSQLKSLEGKTIRWEQRVYTVRSEKDKKASVHITMPETICIATQRPKDDGKKPPDLKPFDAGSARFLLPSSDPVVQLASGQKILLTAKITKAYQKENGGAVLLILCVTDWKLTKVSEPK